MPQPAASKFNLKSLIALSDYRRPWSYCWLAALSIGLPIVTGAQLGNLAYGMIGALGGLVIVYLPQTSLPNRMATLALCAFGFCFCFALALLTSFNPYLASLSLGFVAFLSTLIFRYYSFPPPASMFFVMVCCVGLTLTPDFSQTMARTGALMFGTLAATLMAFIYCSYRYLTHQLMISEPLRSQEKAPITILFESLLAGIFIGGSYLSAILLGLNNPYWIPISCCAILQAASLSNVWVRNIQRISGTFIGMGVAWLLLTNSPSPFMIGIWIILLSFLIEVFITRNYGLAVIFITPVTLFFAEGTTQTDASLLIFTRFIDTVIGSIIGLIGGWLLHHPDIFKTLKQPAE